MVPSKRRMRCCWRGPAAAGLLGLLLQVVLLLLQTSTVSAQDSSTSSSSSSSSSFNEPFSKSFHKLEHAPCITLFHRNGRLGCGTADHSLQIGKLVFYSYWGTNQNGNANNNNDDNQGSGGAAFPKVDENFVAVIDEYDLTANTMYALMNGNVNGYLKGLLVLNSTGVDYNRDQDYHSPAAQAPRGYGTPSQNLWYGNNQYPWNNQGQGLNVYDFYGMPLAYVPDSDVSDALRQAAQEGSSGSSDFAYSMKAEFNYYMGPDGMNSLECLAWKDSANDQWNPKCLPLGGTSVWAVAGSPEQQQQQNNNDDNDENRKLEQQDDNYNNNQRPVIIVATGMDSTSLFHDLVPGANTAASSILATLMAAKLIGGLADEVLDGLPHRILFGFFQAESYGFVGSRNFLRDVFGFDCQQGVVPAVSRLGDDSPEQACLYPLRHSLEFQKLGQIAGMIAVDQVGLPVADGLLYVHNDGQGDGSFGGFVSDILKSSYTNNFAVSYTSMEDDNDAGAAIPPSPIQSLMQLSGGGLGGAVLTGYDYAFTNQVPYQSHLESNEERGMDLDAIASAATLLARAALGAAYDGGDMDSDTAAQYAAYTIAELSSSDETIVGLANCLFQDGNCQLLQKYNSVEQSNDKDRTGFGYSGGTALGKPPNFYPGVYNIDNGQPFVQVGGNLYGAYDGDDYGKHNSDAFGLQPSVLESSIRGMLNDFLGRGSHGDDGNLVKCSSASSCNKVGYCQANGDYATCSGGGYCVCSRSHYHMALDEGLEAKPGMSTGYFVQSENDGRNSPMYTEPFWSPQVGIHVYRDAGYAPGFITLAAGAVMAGLCYFVAFVVRVGLKKEKMY